MTSITSITVETADTKAAEKFYTDAFALGDRIKVAASDAATSGFRGYTISLITSQPANVEALLDSAVKAGATVIKPFTKSIWGSGAVAQAPDGAILKFATSGKKDTAPASTAVDSVVVLLAADDVAATKKFYADKGFAVGKSFGKYVEFELKGSPVGLGLYSRKALAKDAGVDPEGSGSHRLALNGDLGAFTDPDGFDWK